MRNSEIKALFEKAEEQIQVDEIRKQETYNMMLETMEKQRTPMMSIKIFCFIKFGTWISFFYYLWCYYLLGNCFYCSITIHWGESK